MLDHGGYGLGLLLAAPLYAWLTVRQGIATCAVVILAVGAIGLTRFRGAPPAPPPPGVP